MTNPSSPDLTKTQCLELYKNYSSSATPKNSWLAPMPQVCPPVLATHMYVGEEAIATGVCVHLRPDDAVFSTHRGHGHALAKGVPPREVIAELFGRASHGLLTGTR